MKFIWLWYLLLVAGVAFSLMVFSIYIDNAFNAAFFGLIFSNQLFFAYLESKKLEKEITS